MAIQEMNKKVLTHLSSRPGITAFCFQSQACAPAAESHRWQYEKLERYREI